MIYEIKFESREITINFIIIFFLFIKLHIYYY